MSCHGNTQNRSLISGKIKGLTKHLFLFISQLITGTFLNVLKFQKICIQFSVYKHLIGQKVPSLQEWFRKTSKYICSRDSASPSSQQCRLLQIQTVNVMSSLPLLYICQTPFDICGESTRIHTLCKVDSWIETGVCDGLPGCNYTHFLRHTAKCVIAESVVKSEHRERRTAEKNTFPKSCLVGQ